MLLDVGVDSRYRNVISNPDVTLCIPTNLQVCLVFSVKDEKHLALRELLLLIATAESFQNYEVLSWSLNVDDVHDPVLEIDAKRELLLAKLTIDLLEFDDDVSLDSFDRFVSLQPFSQAFEMDSTHGSTAAAWTNHGVEIFIIDVMNIVVVVEADPAYHGRLLRDITLRFLMIIHQLYSSSVVFRVIICAFRFATELALLSGGSFVVLYSMNIHFHHVLVIYQLQGCVDTMSLAADVDIIYVNDRVLTFSS